MTVADRIRAHAWEKGIERGSKDMGESILLRQMQRKFGVVPTIYKRRIKKATTQQLLSWSDKVLEVNNLESLFVEN